MFILVKRNFYAPHHYFEHIDLLRQDPKTTAQHCRKILNAEVSETVQPDGTNTIDLNLNRSVDLHPPRCPHENVAPSPMGSYGWSSGWGIERIIRNKEEG